MKHEADLVEKNAAQLRSEAIARMSGTAVPTNTVAVDGREEDDLESTYTVYSRGGTKRGRKRKRKDFVPVLKPMIMEQYEAERRERVARSLRRLRKDPKFMDMPIREIMRKHRHRLDIPEPPTVLVNPDAPIRVQVREQAVDPVTQDPAEVPGLSDEAATKALEKMMSKVKAGKTDTTA